MWNTIRQALMELVNAIKESDDFIMRESAKAKEKARIERKEREAKEENNRLEALQEKKDRDNVTAFKRIYRDIAIELSEAICAVADQIGTIQPNPVNIAINKPYGFIYEVRFSFAENKSDEVVARLLNDELWQRRKSGLSVLGNSYITVEVKSRNQKFEIKAKVGKLVKK